MKFLSRQNSKFSASSDEIHKERVYAIVNIGCQLCWESVQELTKLANYCIGQNLELHLLTSSFELLNPSKDRPQKNSQPRHTAMRAERCNPTPTTIPLDESHPCQSLAAAKILLQIENRPESHAFDFFNHALHQIYENLQNPHELEFYRTTCAALSLDFDFFEKLFYSSITKSMMKRDLEQSRVLGASITPTIVWQKDNENKTLAAGLLDYEIIRFRLRQLMRAR